MQVPEKLSLIGGSILLASTLIFTLKSQASNILPRISSGTSAMFKGKSANQSNKDDQNPNDNNSDQQNKDDKAFDDKYQQAQKKHWQTGNWGTAKFYVDDQGTMHVGSGELSGPYDNLVNSKRVKAISLDQSVQAPKDSSWLFASSNFVTTPLASIYGMDKLDTSHVTKMQDMFNDDNNLTNLDVSHFDTSHVNKMQAMFENDSALTSLDVSHFDTSRVIDMNSMFYGTAIRDLDLSNFTTSHVTNMSYMFEYDNSLVNLNLSHFKTFRVTNMGSMFYGDSSLQSLDLSNFSTSHVYSMSQMFEGDSALRRLNLSSFNTSHVHNLAEMIEYDNIDQLQLGAKTKLDQVTLVNLKYKNDNQTLDVNQLQDGNAHPGTWIKQ